eukprot:scaffold110_cov247-Pinguiococcus_pyrenoidosus.AAC.2
MVRVRIVRAHGRGQIARGGGPGGRLVRRAVATPLLLHASGEHRRARARGNGSGERKRQLLAGAGHHRLQYRARLAHQTVKLGHERRGTESRAKGAPLRRAVVRKHPDSSASWESSRSGGKIRLGANGVYCAVLRENWGKIEYGNVPVLDAA